MEHTLIILPTYNEKDNVERIVNGVLESGAKVDVLVVDDDSPDGTGEIVKRMEGSNPRVHLLARTERRGRGYAGLAGYLWGLDHPEYAWIGEMDADGSHDPVWLPRLFTAMADTDMVLCSRLVPGGGETGRPLWRRLVTLAANAFIRSTMGLTVRDCTSGYRLMRREALAALPLDRVASPGPAIVQEILFLFARAGFRVREIPYRFSERAAGSSKLGLKTLLRSLRDVRAIRRRFARFRLPESAE